CMRTARIKVQADEGEAMYHCMTRTVNGERLFDDQAKEVLRKQLWQIADYCGVQIVTYAILSNHFHVLLTVPQRQALSDDELLRRYRILYPKPTRYQQAHHEVLVKLLKDSPEDPEAVAWRQRQLALMGDVSQFMKLVKQRFSVWFNRSHGRYGTLWSERFKSVLVEGNGRVLTAMSAYIDLNAVRAGLVADPKDYRFCGYAEAVAGNPAARTGLARVTEGRDWRQVQAGYRQVLFGTGAGPREQGGGIAPEELQKVMAAKGKLPLHTVLRCRVRYFTDGAVLGSQAFVAAHLETYRRTQGRRERTAPRPLPDLTDWGDLNTLRGLRKNTFG
ncbi:MAG: transposase, partial [Verrucomicrobiota bacterium]